MVKSPKKSRSPLPAPTPAQRQQNKYTAPKVSKKFEKSKTTPVTNAKGSPKSKSPITDVDAPTSSKQSTFTVVGNTARPKSPPKTPIGGAWKRVEKGKKDQSMNNNRKHVRNPKRVSPCRSTETKSLSPPRPTSESSHTEEVSTFEEAEISSLIHTGIIRYSDVLKSRNVPSSMSLRPPIIKPSPPSPPTGNAKNEATAIDLEYFPELGQHRTNQHCSAANRYPRKAASIAIVENPETPCSPESSTLKTETDENVRIVSHVLPSENLTSNSSNQTMIKCQQCQLNAQWLEPVVQTSSTPFSINIPEFNFIQPDISFPRFLMQFEDENYLKAENMALLGLKLALGGSISKN